MVPDSPKQKTPEPITVQVLEGDKVVDTKPLPPDEYAVICGERRYLDGLQVYGNGTVVVTIKRMAAPDA